MNRLGLLGMLCLWTSVAMAQTSHLDLKTLLAKPSTRLVAVELLAAGDSPSAETARAWKALQAGHGADGLRVLVVSRPSADGRCAPLRWIPDAFVCDRDNLVASALGVADARPATFLWSWQGDLLVERGGVNAVEAAAAEYRSREPQIAIDVRAQDGRSRPAFEVMIRTELVKQDKVNVSTEPLEPSNARPKGTQGKTGRGNDRAACRHRDALSPHTVLEGRLTGRGASQSLELSLTSLDKWCTSPLVTVPFDARQPARAIHLAVEELLRLLALPPVLPLLAGRAAPAPAVEPVSEPVRPIVAPPSVAEPALLPSVRPVAIVPVRPVPPPPSVSEAARPMTEPTRRDPSPSVTAAARPMTEPTRRDPSPSVTAAARTMTEPTRRAPSSPAVGEPARESRTLMRESGDPVRAAARPVSQPPPLRPAPPVIEPKAAPSPLPSVSASAQPATPAPPPPSASAPASPTTQGRRPPAESEPARPVAPLPVVTEAARPSSPAPAAIEPARPAVPRTLMREPGEPVRAAARPVAQPPVRAPAVPGPPPSFDLVTAGALVGLIESPTGSVLYLNRGRRHGAAVGMKGKLCQYPFVVDTVDKTSAKGSTGATPAQIGACTAFQLLKHH